MRNSAGTYGAHLVRTHARFAQQLNVEQKVTYSLILLLATGKEAPEAQKLLFFFLYRRTPLYPDVSVEYTHP